MSNPGPLRSFALKILSVVVRVDYNPEKWPFIPCWWKDLLLAIGVITTISLLFQFAKWI